MDRARLDRYCESSAFVLSLATLTVGPLATGAVRPIDFAVVQFLATALLGIWGLRLWTTDAPKLLLPPLIWPALGFMAYAVVRYLNSDIEYVARQEMIKVLVYGAVFLVLLTSFHRIEQTHNLALWLLALGVGIAVYGIFQYTSGSDRVWHFVRPPVYNHRGSGTYICPNHFAGFLELLLPLGLAYALTSRLSRGLRAVIGFLLATLFLGIVVSLSRGGWLATGAGLVVGLAWMLRQRAFRIRALVTSATLVIVAIGFLTQANISQERKSAFAIVDRSEDLRFRIWNPALEMWQDHLWFGVGPNHFNTRFLQYRSSHDQAQRVPDRVHNDYLNTLADWGIVGAALVGAVWVCFFWGLFKTHHSFLAPTGGIRPERANEMAFVLGAGLGLISILVHSLVDFNMHIPANALLVTALMAIAAAHIRFASTRFWFQPGPLARVAITAGVTLLSGYLAVEAWKLTTERQWLERAETEKDAQPHIEALKRAFQRNPNPETAYKIGEAYRAWSWRGEDDYREQAAHALDWLAKTMELDPWNPRGFMRYGMCLDWLGRHDEATPFFEQALDRDRNGYYTVAHMGWHYFQRGDYLTARQWFQRSLEIYWVHNPLSRSYLKIIEDELKKNTP